MVGHSPSYDTIKVFGSLCFAHNQKSKGDKFASRSHKCLFVGYPLGKKGWKLFDLDTQEVFVSRDVKIFEETFSFHDPEDTNIDPSTLVSHYDDIHVDFAAYEPPSPGPMPISSNSPPAGPLHNSPPSPTSRPTPQASNSSPGPHPSSSMAQPRPLSLPISLTPQAHSPGPLNSPTQISPISSEPHVP